MLEYLMLGSFLCNGGSAAYPHHVDADSNPDPSCHFDADPAPACHFDADADPDPTFHFDSDPDPNPCFQIKAKNVLLEQAHNPHILACHLQIDADPDPAYRFAVDPDPPFQFDTDSIRMNGRGFNILQLQCYNDLRSSC